MYWIYRCLLMAVICLPLAVPATPAAQWTVHPTGETNSTGATDNETMHAGAVAIYGGQTSGTVRKGNGYLKFDISSIPAGTAVSLIEWHFYVDTANWPHWSVTPLVADPADMATTPQQVWEDLEAEKQSGYYNDRNENSAYTSGWKTLALGGTANDDLIGLLSSGQDWFAFGGASWDIQGQYYLRIHGHDELHPPYLVVDDTPPPANDTCAGAVVIPGAPGAHSYTGDITYAANDYNCSAACVGSLPHAGNDVAYSITLPAGCEVCATLNQSVMTWNGAAYLVTDCADVDGTCVAGASGWVAGSSDETFCYLSPETETYYLIVDGRSDGGYGPFQLDVDVVCLDGPSDLVCTDIGGAIDLTWTNNGVYDVIEVYIDGNLETAVPGTEEAATVISEPGYHCIHLCAMAGPLTRCSEPCCLIYGYGHAQLLWDFEEDDGGFVAELPQTWEWGLASHGGCAAVDFGLAWATRLDMDYGPNSCWLLDSPPIQLGALGGYLSIDHCYETEFGADGGVLWFTTDDFWYNTSEPVKGADGPITANPGCGWVAGQNGFTGSSGGWVTDEWDLTADEWHGAAVRLRFAFGSDDAITAPGWMIDNITLYSTLINSSIDCDYTVTPTSGTLPFSTVHRMTLSNLLSGGSALTRRISGRISMTIGNGSFFNPWRAGFTNVQPGSSYFAQWSQNLPALATVVGTNIFTLTAMDVTPAPYNQPPYPPSGDSCVRMNMVTAYAP